VSKAISNDLKVHLAGKLTTLATCWKLTRRDNTVFAFTDHDEDIVYGGVTYEAASGFLPTALDQSGGLSVDNLEVTAFLESAKIKEEDVVAGLFDYADVDIFLINYADTTQGILYLAGGWKLGEFRLGDHGFTAEIRSKSQLLQQQILDLYSPDCRAELGDADCGITLEPNDWQASHAYDAGEVVKATTYDGRRYVCTTAGTSGGREPAWDTTIGNSTNDNTCVWTCHDAYTKEGTVTSVDGTHPRAKFTDSGRSETSDLFSGGKLTWTSGDNNGLAMDVKEYDHAAKTFTLMLQMPKEISTGDAYKVIWACDKTRATCKDTFANLDNFRGEPLLKGFDQMVAPT